MFAPNFVLITDQTSLGLVSDVVDMWTERKSPLASAGECERRFVPEFARGAMLGGDVIDGWRKKWIAVMVG